MKRCCLDRCRCLSLDVEQRHRALLAGIAAKRVVIARILYPVVGGRDYLPCVVAVVRECPQSCSGGRACDVEVRVSIIVIVILVVAVHNIVLAVALLCDDESVGFAAYSDLLLVVDGHVCCR